MRSFIIFLLLVHSARVTHALIINEVFSNPIGDDGGREWVELYNPTDTEVTISGTTLSVKGGAPISVSHISGPTSVAPYGYAIIASTVSGQTKFMLDYPSYNGPLFKSSLSLVNTGVTSLSVSMGGLVMDTLSSYTAAKEGSSYAFVDSAFVQGSPTPGLENIQAASQVEASTVTSTAQSSGGQITIPQMSAPSSDIILYLPFEKTVVAGAPTLFSTQATTRSGKILGSVLYSWSFGDGGQGVGSTTVYRYLYPGRYILQVEGESATVLGTGRMVVKVVAPDIALSPIAYGKYGNYIDIINPNVYDLDISGWKVSIDGALYQFPKNTLVGSGATRITGAVMGFASTTVSTSTIIKLLFPTMEEVTRVNQGEVLQTLQHNIIDTTKDLTKVTPLKVSYKKETQRSVVQNVLPEKIKASSSVVLVSQTEKKDSRLADFIKSLFNK